MHVVDTLRGGAVRACNLDEVEAVRRHEQALELGQLGRRQVGEDAAAVVVDYDERGGRRRAEQAVGVVQEAEVAAQSDGEHGRVRLRDPDHRRHEPVDAVRAAVGEEAEPGPRRHGPLERAHRQARRDDERCAVWKRGGEIARDQRVARRGRGVERAVDRGAGGLLGALPVVEPR